MVNQSLSNPEYLGIRDCFSQILKKEGPWAFWRGIFYYNSGTVSPLIGYGAQGSLAFGANEVFKDLISYLDPKKSTQNSGIMPMSHVLLSGVLTGMVSSFALVILFLFSRLQPTTSESYSKKK